MIAKTIKIVTLLSAIQAGPIPAQRKPETVLFAGQS